MALNVTKQEHDDNPPETWIVKKASERVWQLCLADGGVLESTTTKKAAEELKTSGFYFDLYRDEGLWMNGQPVPHRHWRPFADCLAENERLALKYPKVNS